MIFEFDPYKSELNKIKHQIDFIAAQNLWQDKNCFELAVNYVDEPRYLTIGKIAAKHWTAIITYQGSNVRIISVRRARKEEISIYESRRIR